MVFDLETMRSFEEVGSRQNIHLMGLAVAVTYSEDEKRFRFYTEENVKELVEELKRGNPVVGFNLYRFDYRVLQPYTSFPLETLPTLDIMEEVYRKVGFRVSLDHLAWATLGTGKSGDGLLAVHLWRQGWLEELMEYCRKDVELTWQLYDFGRRNKYIVCFDRSRRKLKIPVNW
ncbi:MAG: ribonuclease H-like domain-containing protein [Anaerolineae bacterium]|nr:ribonuclease H-like domain-containing protein [Anaerolineae bacterium]